jgi:RNA polymerase sigma-70 factor
MSPNPQGQRDPLAVLPERCLASFYTRSGAGRWGLDRELFDETLRSSVTRCFSGAAGRPASAGAAEIERYLESLHLEDLALASACAAGLEAAWEYFVAHYRESLCAAARAILGSARDPELARDLADSLYAELYGLEGAAGARHKPLFIYFHGRSSLATWLRAVLAQRHVDSIRAGRRQISLEDAPEQAERADARAPRPSGPDPDRERYLALLHAALREALSLLSSRDRALLRGYYVDAHTLAEIGQSLGEHESTVSRHLERCRHDLRVRVERLLLEGAAARDGRAARPGLNPAQVDLCFEYALEDWPFDLSRALDRAAPGKTGGESGPVEDTERRKR